VSLLLLFNQTAAAANTKTKQFGNWWRGVATGVPVLEGGDSRKYAHWWKGAPILQSLVSVNTYSYVATGGLNFGGEASAQNVRSHVHVASGGMTFGGSATAQAQVHRDHSATGGAAFGGSATLSRTFSGNSNLSVVVGTFTSDGAASQRIVVSNYPPACVMVMGKVSGVEKGAIKTRSMPSTASHKWANDEGALVTDRITALHDDGFTVGSALNGNAGDTYVFITWPLVDGFTAEGSYAGSGATTDTVGAIFNIGVTIPNQIIELTGGTIRAEDIGRTIYRDSDHAVMCVIGSRIDATHLNAVITNTGILGSGQWYMNPRSIALPFAPDFGVLMPDAAVSASTPVSFVPGLLSDSDLFDATPTGNEQNFNGQGTAPPTVSLPSGSSTMYVATATSSGTGGFDASGVNYYWFMAKAGTEVANFEYVDYTGDGSTPRDIGSTTFIPTFFMVFGPGVIPFWKAAGLPFTDTTFMAPFNDGTAAVDEEITFNADGFHVASGGGFNQNAVPYRAYFMRPTLIPRGMVFGGSAEYQYKPAGARTRYFMEAVGGARFGGAAACDLNTDARHDYTATGGMVFGGAATASVVHAGATYSFSASGGMEFGGTAFYERRYRPETSGGLVFGGAADSSFVQGEGGTQFFWTMQGGMRFGGRATTVRPRPKPTPTPPVRGAGGADLVRQPFWGAPGTRVRAEIFQPAAAVEVYATSVEDELMSEENQILGLL